MGTYLGADGVRLHVDEVGVGAGEPVIVVPGGPGRHPEYLGDVAGLGERHRLVIPHLRGAGLSPAPLDPRGGSAWEQAADLAALVRALGSTRAVVIGHSAGTRPALALAVRFPERVGALVLVTPPPNLLGPPPADADPAPPSDPVRGEAWRRLMAGPEGPDDFGAWQAAVAPLGYAHWGEREQAHARGGVWSADAARDFFAVPPPPDLAERAARLALPTLVLAGGRDRFLTLRAARAVADGFAGGRLAVVDDAGHYPWVEQPEPFRAALDPFLDAPA